MSEPLYPRLLGLKNVHPNAWQRAALGEGMAGIGILLSLADLASAWSIIVLPLAVAGVVKAHDVLIGWLPERAAAPRPGSSELWKLLEMSRDGTEGAPFALIETADTLDMVVPPTGVLTHDELVGALRLGLTEIAAGEDPPARMLIVFEGGAIGYEPGVGLVMDAEQRVKEAPSVYPDSEKAPTP